MSIPLDRLYNYLDNIIGDNIIIYRFFPHGSRKLEDLSMLREYTNGDFIAICNDQEPLNYNYYENLHNLEEMHKTHSAISGQTGNNSHWIVKKNNNWFQANKNILLRSNIKLGVTIHGYLHKAAFLLNSERRSENLTQYECTGEYIGIYWWAHAIIARDWYRHAKIDPELTIKSTIINDFLIYNRSWSGSREYRLKFAELLIKNNLYQHCQMKFNCIDETVHYRHHIFKNTQFSTVDVELEKYFEKNIVESTASADYVSSDYQTTRLEVVLETLFDDKRLHLTEKSLRPIACGHAFILMATHGSLAYLRSYGFKTFSPYINEKYDDIEDPLTRMNAVLVEMKRLVNLSEREKNKLQKQVSAIIAHNKKLFFSEKWHNYIIDELKNNIYNAKKRTQLTI